MAEKIGFVLLLLVLCSFDLNPAMPWTAGSLAAQESETPNPLNVTVTLDGKPLPGVIVNFKPLQDGDDDSEPSSEIEATDIGSAPDQKALDNLERFLVGSSWKGTFTITGQTEKLIPEAYEIVSAKREPTGDEWMLVAKIKYGDKDVKVPVGLLIKWVDRTPMIVLDQVPIPGMGTFDARVIIRRGMYAGTWAHGEKGGHLFGEITTTASKEEKQDDAP